MLEVLANVKNVFDVNSYDRSFNIETIHGDELSGELEFSHDISISKVFKLNIDDLPQGFIPQITGYRKAKESGEEIDLNITVSELGDGSFEIIIEDQFELNLDSAEYFYDFELVQV